MSGHGPRGDRDCVERYLRRLSLWVPRASRHDLVMEAERHLYEATRRAERDGLTHEVAQRAALRAFGPAWRVGLAARGLDDHPLLVSARRAANALSRSARRLRPPHRMRVGRRPRLF